MSEFSRNPIINSPYAEPSRHWELDSLDSPTGEIGDGRRTHRYFIPIPAARLQRQQETGELGLNLAEVQTERKTVNSIRAQVSAWRALPPHKWGVTHVTRRLLEHWRGESCKPRLFFCQLEAIETFIWLNEVAPNHKQGREFLREISESNDEANPKLMRMAAKMATGAGKTTVMAMLIAYHAVNHSRAPKSKKFAGRFLVIAPGITIKDRLRVLLPQDPENYYETRGIAPPEFSAEVKNARVVITNYQAFQRRELQKMSKRQREILRGNAPQEKALETKETTGQMLRRVCPGLLGGAVAVINDEAHHCYKQREKTEEEKRAEEAVADADDREEADRSKEAARLWINGIYDLQEKTPICGVYDLSATPFFLRGSGYAEGHLFPWVVSDFSLMEAIESGIVKLPRVPVQDTAQQNTPIYRDIYSRISDRLPVVGRQTDLDPESLPEELMGAITTLYESYRKTAEEWKKAKVGVPPVFIVVCNNTSVSQLVFGRLCGYKANEETGEWRRGVCDMFNNVGQDNKPLARPRSLLIDSYRLETGEALTPEFKKAAAAEIEQFKRDLRIRFPERDADKITDEDLLREAMNTIGKPGKLGEQIRCVVSVSMLTEGWDASTVTHILGVRKFGTQLLCEQIVGRGLRRLSYDVDEKDMLSPEYADVFGVPFNFARGDSNAKILPPKPQTRVRHLPERDDLEIRFPRVRNYIIRPPQGRIVANFSADSRFVIEPKMAPPKTEQRGIVGKGVMMTLDDLKRRRENEVVFYLAAHICHHYYEQVEGRKASQPRFKQLVPIVRRWLQTHLICAGETFMQYLLWQAIANRAAEIIYRACVPSEDNMELLLPVMDPYTPEGSTMQVDFLTSKKLLHKTKEDKSHINIAVCDSEWEMDFCRVLEEDAGVFAYVRNDGLGFEVPYTHDKQKRVYKPDFIILANDGNGRKDLLHLVAEIKGLKDEAARAKADTMRRFWIPAVNNAGKHGRWAFEEFMDMQDAQAKLAKYTRGGAAE